MQGSGRKSETSSDPPIDEAWISPRDQKALFGIAVVLLIAMAGLWIARGGPWGQVIQIDRAPPLHAEFAVDINRADWPEILQLPGLGEILARRIVEHRQVHGPFTSIEQLDQVNGIGPRTMQRVRPYLLPIADETEFAGVAAPGTVN